MKSFIFSIVKELTSEKWTIFCCHNTQNVMVSKSIAGDTVKSSNSVASAKR